MGASLQLHLPSMEAKMRRNPVYRRHLKPRSFQQKGFKFGPYSTITIFSLIMAAAIHML